MNIENDIFKRSSINFKKVLDYGFKKIGTNYIFEKNFLNDDFKAIITINKEGIVTGKVIDLQINEEYTNIRTKMSGEFVTKVREEYKNILIDIKNSCFEERYFISNQANRITKYVKEKYNTEPEFLWGKSEGSGVFRNSNNNKWYGLIMNIDLSKIDDGTGEIEIINLKLDRNKIKNLIKENGYYEAYHMNKKDWISIILNDTLEDNEIEKLIDESYSLIK